MKLFVSDIDGTLVWYNNKNNKCISEQCKNAIHIWVNKGNIFAVATARTYLKKNVIIDDLGINIDYLGGNGAEVVYQNGKTNFHSLPYSYFLEIGKWIDENGYDATLKICVNGMFYAYRKDNYPFTFPERMRNNLIEAKEKQDLKHDNTTVGVNMSLLCIPKLTKKIEKELQELFSEKCQVIATDIDNIDFIPLGIGKGQAVISLADYYGIDKENIIVAGDEANDICMFDIAGTSYCMSHSSKEIQQKATKVVNVLEEAIFQELNNDE